MSTSAKMKQASSQEAFQAIIDARRSVRMNNIDRMAPDLRKCVHDYGLNIVQTCLDLGIRKPKHIRHLVETVLDEFSPTRGSSSAQGGQRRVD